jgi:hypothetical protein
LTLPEHNPEAFAYYMSFLYNPTDKPQVTINGSDDVTRALKLYVLASMICEQALQVLIVETVYNRIGRRRETTYLKPHHVQYIYQHTGAGDRMRLLLAETLVMCCLGEAGSTSFLEGWEMGSSPAGDLGLDIIKIVNKKMQPRICGVAPCCVSCGTKTYNHCRRHMPLLQKSDISDFLHKVGI